MMTKDGLIFEANSLKQGRLQALTRQQLQAQATQNRERRWVAGSPRPSATRRSPASRVPGTPDATAMGSVWCPRNHGGLQFFIPNFPPGAKRLLFRKFLKDFS